jgi:hypothetical protein
VKVPFGHFSNACGEFVATEITGSTLFTRHLSFVLQFLVPGQENKNKNSGWKYIGRDHEKNPGHKNSSRAAKKHGKKNGRD